MINIGKEWRWMDDMDEGDGEAIYLKDNKKLFIYVRDKGLTIEKNTFNATGE